MTAEYVRIPHGAVDPSEIVRLRAQGLTYAEIARATGYGAMHAESIVNAAERGRDVDANVRRTLTARRRLDMRLTTETREQLFHLARHGESITGIVARAIAHLYAEES